MGRVRFFCNCGKEIWEDMSKEDKELLTVGVAEDGCKCANCFLKENRERSILHASFEKAVAADSSDGPVADTVDGYRLRPGEE